jgi:6-pyruvoyltetrahydropterin/6-carboxytetrahydropterin synthase
MKAYLTRRAVFSASHRLHSDQLSDAENKKIFGKCNHPGGHGHNYVLEVTVKGTPDPKTGMIMNLADLKEAIETQIMAEVDHKHLNVDCPSFRGVNPTAENIAIVFWQLLEKKLPRGSLHEIKLYETENNTAVYRGE